MRIGPGEAGRAFRESLAAADPSPSFAAFDQLPPPRHVRQASVPA